MPVKGLAVNGRHATAQLIAFLAEMDARRLYLAEGCSSLFTYCTQVLHLSEHARELDNPDSRVSPAGFAAIDTEVPAP